MTDQALTADQCRIGRAAMGMTQEDLAAAAGVPRADIVALEHEGTVSPGLAAKLLDALAKAGVTFYVAEDGSVRMRARTLDGVIEAPVLLSRGRPS